MVPNSLPEGTDSIIEDPEVYSEIDASGAIPIDSGAQADADAASDASVHPDPSPFGTARAAFEDAKGKAGENAADLKGQATDKLRAYAVSGKDKATESLTGVAKMIEDAALQIDDKVGTQYGDYARQAAQTIAGLASDIDGKDVDELFGQARDVVRKSPGVAISAAAAIGFAVARVAKAGIDAGRTTMIATPPGDNDAV